MILKFYKNQAFQRLNAYYGQSTVFDVLGVQRSENRHSAFLKWLFDPGASINSMRRHSESFLLFLPTRLTLINARVK